MAEDFRHYSDPSYHFVVGVRCHARSLDQSPLQPSLGRYDSQQQVVSVMGRPDRTGPCGELGGSPDGCVFEYLYFPRSLTITAWAVFFDKSGNVVGRYYYVSY